MKTLELNQMEKLSAGSSWWDWNEPLKASDFGCMTFGLLAGVASGFNPFVGGLTALACMLTV